MKISIDIDCTPEEARTFLGLPDVAAFQESMMKSAQAQMAEHFQNLDPEALMKIWMPSGLKVWEGMQEAFTAQFTGGAKGSAKTDE